MDYFGAMPKRQPDTLLKPVVLTLMSESPELHKIMPSDQPSESRPAQSKPDKAPEPLSVPQPKSRPEAEPKVRKRPDPPSLKTPGRVAAPQFPQVPTGSTDTGPGTADMPAPASLGGGTETQAGKRSQGAIAEVAGQAVSQSPVREAVPLYDRNPPPQYPQQARKRGFQGTVILKVLVGKDGRVADLRVQESSGHDILDQIALEAVRGWAFMPGRRGDEPVEMWVRVPILFELK